MTEEGGELETVEAEQVEAVPRPSLARKRQAFVREYIRNGYNGAQAAIATGYSPTSARDAAHEILRRPDIQRQLARYAERADIKIDHVLREVRQIATNDARRFLTDDGRLRPVSEWDASMGAAVASIEVNEIYEGRGEQRELRGYAKKLKFWDKTRALDSAMKHLGLFEVHNQQKAEPQRRVEIVFVPSPPPRKED